jgi:hypothetical protein
MSLTGGAAQLRSPRLAQQLVEQGADDQLDPARPGVPPVASAERGPFPQAILDVESADPLVQSRKAKEEKLSTVSILAIGIASNAELPAPVSGGHLRHRGRETMAILGYLKMAMLFRHGEELGVRARCPGSRSRCCQ